MAEMMRVRDAFDAPRQPDPPDLYSNGRHGAEPAIKYFVAADDTHGLVVAMPGEGVGATLSLSDGSPVALSAATPFDTWFKWPSTAASKPPWFEFTLKPTDGGSEVKWRIEMDVDHRCLRYYGEDCASPAREAAARGIGWPMAQYGGPLRDADLPYVAQLAARRDDSRTGNDLVLGPLGFAALIAVMAAEILHLGKALRGLTRWGSRAVRRRGVDKRHHSKVLTDCASTPIS